MSILPVFTRPLVAIGVFVLIAVGAGQSRASSLPFDTVFKGRSQFDSLVAQADKWKALPIGQRVAEVGRAMTGTRYKSYTLEIDDRVEAPSVNLTGLDCWTFFESALAFARMLDEPQENWTPQTMLKYIEIDRYRGGKCTGSYLSRLHYLEDWLHDNDRRGQVRDLTRDLGGIPAAHDAVEMTRGWKSYRYMRKNPDLRTGIAQMEARVASEPLYYVPKSQVAGIESRLQSGDIIGICSHDGGLIGTAHVGLAYRTSDGVLHFMHASAPHNYNKVVLDQRLSDYLYHFRTDAGIIVGRPLR
ncbi:MAG: N-acetylmuramoyl-L-alanine amidase-like domain-containing protein [Chthoniobacter sp.]